MLRRFLYLDSPALNEYLSAAEDGIRIRSARVAASTGERKGELNVKLVSGSVSGGSTSQVTNEFEDTDQSRFGRLLNMAAGAEEELGWVEVQTLDQLAEVGFGAMIHAEVEIYVPDFVRLLAGDEMPAALELMDQLRPLAPLFDLDTSGLPSQDQSRAMRGILGALKSDLVVVGEQDACAYRLAARLKKDWIRDNQLEGYVRLVGKITQRWGGQDWRPFLALPGAGLLPRAERRKLSARPEAGQEDQYLQGPAGMVELLAIYQ